MRNLWLFGGLVGIGALSVLLVPQSAPADLVGHWSFSPGDGPNAVLKDLAGNFPDLMLHGDASRAC